MSLAEGVQARVTYKFYSTGAIASNSQPTSASDPGASGGQVLRRTTCTLDLSKGTYKSAEVTTDHQNSDYRHGGKKVSGSIGGELSPGTYWDFIEAATRGTKQSAIALSESDLTSAAFDATASTVTFGGGAPVTLGLRVGDVIRCTNLATAANNSTNFLILGFSGTSNRVLSIYPAPVTETADTSFNVTTVGKSVFVPSTGFVSRKVAIEVYHSDIDAHRLFTENRVGGVKINLPATGMSTIDIPLMGRDMETGSGVTSPFFTAPAAPTTTGILAAVNGLIRLGGVTLGVVTGANVDLNLNPSSSPVVGQNVVPEIFLGVADVTGQLTANLEDLTMVNYFKNETEVELLLFLTASSAGAADAMTIYMPRVKLGGASVGISGEGAQIVTMPFQALKYQTAGNGIEATTIRFTDTAAV